MGIYSILKEQNLSHQTTAFYNTVYFDVFWWDMNNVKISAFNIVVSNNLNCVQKYDKNNGFKVLK